MMLRQGAKQSPMFSKSITLGDRIPERHLLRRVKSSIDFEFVYAEVEALYGAVGNPSVPPPIILKLMVLLVLYNVRSERELMATLPLRLDWLWFLGYDLESETPTHSVLSKARARWGVNLFETFFQRVLDQCIQTGLVDGRQVFVDSSLIEANASIDSLFDRKKATTELQRRLDEPESPNPKGDASTEQSKAESKPAEESKQKPAEDQKEKTARYRSSTDPDATGAKHRGDKMRPRYATHRMIDASSTVITATVIGPGHQNEAELLVPLIEQHEKRTEAKVETLTADGKYGVLENLVACEERDILTYVVPFRDHHTTRGGKFAECDFLYDPQSDTYLCPAKQPLKRAAYRPDRNAYKYTAPRKACQVCSLRSHCTTSKKAPRTILRHVKQELIDRSRKQAMSDQGRASRKSRMARMEGSFAWSCRLGFKRARWRGLDRMRIQDLLIATTQNCLILLRGLLSLPEKAANRVSTTFVYLVKLLKAPMLSSFSHSVPAFT